METRTIPPEQWIEFFDRFSQDHAGWPVTIEVLDQQSGRYNVAEALPLQGISFDTKGTRPCALDISAGDESVQHVSHVVDMPLNIHKAQNPNGDIDIEIEPASGPVTLVHLRSPVH